MKTSFRLLAFASLLLAGSELFAGTMAIQTKARTKTPNIVPTPPPTSCHMYITPYEPGPPYTASLVSVPVLTSITADGKPYSTGTIQPFYLYITTPSIVETATLEALYYYADYTNANLVAPGIPPPPPPPPTPVPTAPPSPTPTPTGTPSPSPSGSPPPPTPTPTYVWDPGVPAQPPVDLTADSANTPIPIPKFYGSTVTVLIAAPPTPIGTGWPAGVGQAVYTAKLHGPGGTGQCQITVKAICQYQPVHCNVETNGQPANGACWAPVNNPPYCDWWLIPPGALRGPWDGCFPPETKIRLANGQDKLAAFVRVGDELWNPVRRRGVKVKLTNYGPEKPALFELGYQLNGHLVRVRVTSKHPMVTPQGPRQADTLTADDSILGADQRFHKLTALRRLPVRENQKVYNFELDTESTLPEDHMIQADGIVTGDLYLQKRLGKTSVP